MPSFLSALLILVSSFVLGAKPVDIPPFIADEISQRGNQVSELVKHLPTLSPTPTQSEEPDVIDNSHSPNNNNGYENNDSQNPDTNKVPAYNNRSEKEIPTNLPQEAIDNSPALDPVPTEVSNAGFAVSPEGKKAHIPDEEPGIEPEDRSLGIYDAPPVETPLDLNDYKPLEIEYPGGIMTVYENNPQNINPDLY